MIYETAADWLQAKEKRVLLFGMSGLGKTHISNLLREAGDWFHYSVDYRIGTRYLGEHITDNFKREAMKNPFLRQLLLTDSIYVASNITFDNLAPLSSWLGKPGDPTKGGLSFAEYQRRQELHHDAEVAALTDTTRFIDRAAEIYGYGNFVCDSGGSICEVVDPEDARDPVLRALSEHLLMVWIEGSEAHTEELVRRFKRAPKPMYYRSDFMMSAWRTYLEERDVAEAEVDPDDFMAATYARAMAHRQPLYAAMAKNWGVTVKADDVAQVRSADDFTALVARALETR
ncbi:MAG TPA: ATPase [Rhodobacteraceae bacterium]|nr:ATPase [Paracoccaceae bacterium]